MDDWAEILRREAGSYARVALANIKREFPSGIYHTMKAPGDFPYRPRARTPAFYGSFDWHSAVEMHWVLVRLLRTVPAAVPADEIRAALGPHFERVARGPVRVGLGARAGPRDGYLGRPARPEVGRRPGTSGRQARRAVPGLAAARRLPGPGRSARQQRVRDITGPAVRGGPGGGRRSGAADRSDIQGAGLVRRRHDVPGGVGAIRTGLPVPRADRGRADGPGAARRPVRGLAGDVPAGDRAAVPGRAVHAGGGVGFQRWPPRPPARTEREPGLVLAAAGRHAAGRGPAGGGRAGGGPAARGGGAAARGRRRLHGGALAGSLRSAAAQLAAVGDARHRAKDSRSAVVIATGVRR